MKKALFYLLSIILIQSCSVFNQTVHEIDLVNKSDRYKSQFNYYNAQEFRSPFIRSEQTIVKEVYKDSTSFLVYDLVSVHKQNFDLEPYVYFIVDYKTILKIEVDIYEKENNHRLSEKTKMITISDATQVDVVSRYSHKEWDDFMLHYRLNEDYVKQLTKANALTIRYYSGANMISLKLDEYKLKRLKLLLTMNNYY